VTRRQATERPNEQSWVYCTVKTFNFEACTQVSRNFLTTREARTSQSRRGI